MALRGLLGSSLGYPRIVPESHFTETPTAIAPTCDRVSIDQLSRKHGMARRESTIPTYARDSPFLSIPVVPTYRYPEIHSHLQFSIRSPWHDPAKEYSATGVKRLCLNIDVTVHNDRATPSSRHSALDCVIIHPARALSFSLSLSSRYTGSHAQILSGRSSRFTLMETLESSSVSCLLICPPAVR